MDSQILENTYTKQASPFSIIEEKAVPRIASPKSPYFLGLPLLGIIALLYIHFIGIQPFLYGLGLLLVLSVGFSLAVFVSRTRRQRKDALEELLNSLCLELENLHSSLDEYLNRLDTRASRYFNSMTPSESALRYFLAQISIALEHRVRKVRFFLAEPSHENIAAAYQYLQTPLRIRESVVEKDSRHKLIPLRELRSISASYVQNIESVLSRIEKEREEKTYDYGFCDEYDNGGNNNVDE